MDSNTFSNRDHDLLFDIGRLYAQLATLEDKRHAKGKRYSLALVLLLMIFAKLCGEDTPSGIADWARLRTKKLVSFLQLERETLPCHNTYRRVLSGAVDLLDFQRITSRFLTHGLDQGRSILIAIDGKTLRGTIPKGETKGVHLLAAYLPQEGIVLMQVAVDEKENEIKAAPTLLQALDLRHKVVRGDAMLTQRKLSAQILEAGGDYVWVVKENQPQLLSDIEEVFDPPPSGPAWSHVPRDLRTAETVDIGHGRLEKRTLTASCFLNEYVEWPGLAQVFRLERQVLVQRTGELRKDITYGITSLSPREGPAGILLEYLRGYWGIENGLHYRRDQTLHEDATRMSNPNLAEGMAIINNLVIGLTKWHGLNNLAAARRFYSAFIGEALARCTTSFS
jgi:predicted transposase YbfD/YdcC